jgi:spore maturation protein CgeB
MKIVIFGLSVSSSWGNGHATLWRGLCASLARRGHRTVFFERDTPYYAAARDLAVLPGGELILYSDWELVEKDARKHLTGAEVGIVTSYCPDALAASRLLNECKTEVRCFYDLDTPITLDRLERGLPVSYIGDRGLQDFDLTLSYAGGDALERLQKQLGARTVAPLYGSVDTSTHFPVNASEAYRSDVSYLGTWAADRQQRLEELFVEPAKQLANCKFLIGGSMYNADFPWQPNIYLKNHVPPTDHPSFYCSAKLNLNVTRQAMADNGWCPSGRLFEATACGCATLTDPWPGLEQFFEPESEILVAANRDATVDALSRPIEDLHRLGKTAREKTMEFHTADVRARELEECLAAVMS